MKDYFQDTQERINTFLVVANKHLAALPKDKYSDGPLYFDGRYITGKLDRPEILFMGINPGHGAWANLKDRTTNTRVVPFEQVPIDYLEGYKHNELFSKRIVDVLLNGNVELLHQCATTNFLSPFATPNVAILKRQLAALPKELQAEHNSLICETWQHVNPKRIVTVGWAAWDQFRVRFNKYEKGASDKAAYGKGQRDYFAWSVVDGTPLYGTTHLSGARPTKEMLEKLNEKFQRILAVEGLAFEL